MVILLILAIGFAIYCFGYFIHEHYSEKLPKIVDPGDDEWDFFGQISIKIRGASHYNGSEDVWQGYIVAELHNPQDPNAISIIDRNFSMIGYLPRGNSDLHRCLINRGDRFLPAKFSITVDGDIKYGIVNLDDEKYPWLTSIHIVTGF